MNLKFIYTFTLSLTLMMAIYVSTHDSIDNMNVYCLVSVLTSLVFGYLGMIYLPDVKPTRRNVKKTKQIQTELSDIVKDLFG